MIDCSEVLLEIFEGDLSMPNLRRFKDRIDGTVFEELSKLNTVTINRFLYGAVNIIYNVKDAVLTGRIDLYMYLYDPSVDPYDLLDIAYENDDYESDECIRALYSMSS
jgi:hypothetical protein